MKITQQQMDKIKRADPINNDEAWINRQGLPVIISQLTEAGYGFYYAVKVQPSGNLTRVKGINGYRMPGDMAENLRHFARQQGYTTERFATLEVQP
jgi:hypothetical protein